jgi:hypothetical protein
MMKGMTPMLMLANHSPYVISPWGTSRTIVKLYKAPLVFQSTLLKACEFYKCTLRVLIFKSHTNNPAQRAA